MEKETDIVAQYTNSVTHHALTTWLKARDISTSLKKMTAAIAVILNTVVAFLSQIGSVVENSKAMSLMPMEIKFKYGISLDCKTTFTKSPMMDKSQFHWIKNQMI